MEVDHTCDRFLRENRLPIWTELEKAMGDQKHIIEQIETYIREGGGEYEDWTWWLKPAAKLKPTFLGKGWILKI